MILFLHGADTFRSRQKLREITEKFQREVDPQGYNLTRLDGNEVAASDIIESAGAAPFLADKRMLVIEELSAASFKKDEEESLLDLFKRIMDDDMILVAWEGELKKQQLSTEIFKLLQTSKFVMPFEAMNARQVAGWMRQKFTEHGLSIARDALHDLSLSVEDDLWKAASEVEKLAAYAKANEITELKKSHVGLLVAGGVQDNVFALVDAVSSRQTKEAMSRLKDQMASGTHELEILSMLFRQYRLLQQIKSGQQEGMSPDAMAKEYKLHPFVVKKTAGQASSIDENRIAAAYARLARTDLLMKSSSLKSELLLTKTVATLSV